MNCISVQAIELNDGRIHVYYSALNGDGTPDHAADSTLLDLIDMAHWGSDMLDSLCSLVQQAESGGYVSADKARPDFGINDVNLWISEATCKPGTICITNENTIYTLDQSGAQLFAYSQFWQTLDCYKRLRAMALERGEAYLLVNPIQLTCE